TLPMAPPRAQSVPASTARPQVALALSGGAARGAAHVGVIQELVAAGIPIDLIVGTSIGAIVGGMYAAGFAADELPELLVFVDPATTARSQLPLRGGVLDNAPLGRILAALLEDRAVTDTRIPFRGVVTDLATGETHAPDDAPLALVLQASAAVPILFNPVAIGDRHYIDGGLKQLVPTENARRLGADYVVAVDLGRDLAVDPESIQSTAALTLGGLVRPYTEASLAAADVVIRPSLPDAPHMDFDQREAYVEAGRRAARDALPAIRAGLARLGVPLRDGGDPHWNDPINLGWRERVAGATLEVGAPALRLALRVDATTALTHAPTGLSDRIGVTLTVRGGPLQWASVGVDLGRGNEPQANVLALRLGVRLPGDTELHAGVGAQLARGPSLRVGVRRGAAPGLTLGVAHDLLAGVTEATASYRPDHAWIDAEVAGRAGLWARAGVDARGAIAGATAGRGTPEVGVRLFALAASGATPDAYAVQVDPGRYRTASSTAVTRGLVGGSVEFRTALHDPVWLTEVAELTTHGRAFLDVVRHDARTRAGIGLGVTLDGRIVGLLPFRLELDLGVDLTDGTVRLGLRNGADGPAPWRPSRGPGPSP
ncbi:MAG: patatin-like phospholipase family protein, partial [Trueperaceae bacterium]|nr:patatin-like phospholipase family protein [Trueperaceae bacterium]